VSHPPTPGRRSAGLTFSAAAILVATALGSPATAAAAEGTIQNAGGPTAVAGSYIVVLSNNAVAQRNVATRAQNLVSQYGGDVKRTYQNALRGFEAQMSDSSAAKLAADPAVRLIAQNHTVTLEATQSPVPSWGLDRIDQRDLPLNNSYTYPTVAQNVTAYVIDTGVRFSHQTFGGRARSGRDTVDNDNDATDCHGHGTHVAGTIGGSQYGVAKGVSIVGVRVLDCQGSGTNAGVVAGIDWAAGDHDPGELAVANMSLGGAANAAVDTAVTNAVADGITFAVAAGNGDALGNPQDACGFSPARVPTAITVGATQNTDARASFSNYGTCLDVFAPGVGITSSWLTNDTATNTISGTSMASPHVAGVAALILSANPTFSPQQVRDKLVNDASSNKVTDPRAGSPNKLLYVDNAGNPPPPPPPPRDDFSISLIPTSATITAGDTTSTMVNTAVTAGSAQMVNLTASGLPSGATATFAPTSVNAGASSSLTIRTSTTTPNGTYPITVTGTGPSATHTTTFTLNVTGGSGACTGTNNTDYPINDLATVESPINIIGCSGNASATSKVEVHIVHTWRGDLVVSLIAPDGSAYVLHNQTGGSADNIDQTYTVNLGSEARNGTWKLRVRDAALLDTGYINSWTLTL
jgi:subtilisin family serine protease